MKDRLLDKYGNLFEQELLIEISQSGIYKKIPKDFSMIDIGDSLTHMPLILSGAIRVMEEDEKENEYLLYYLEVGDSCTMTLSCCLGGKKSKIKAISEIDTEIIMVPIQKMEAWLIKYKTWRVFVFDSYDARITELLQAVDSLAFHDTKERIYLYLRERAMVLKSATLNITHYKIANDLNTSRVVVSRLMKKLVLDGKIEMNRNEVNVIEFLA